MAQSERIVATPEAGEKAAQDIFANRLQSLESQGLTYQYLIKKLKRELNAKETRITKYKTNAKAEEILEDMANGMGVKVSSRLAKGIKKLAEGTDEVVIGIDMVAWDVRQKARIDAHKLRGDYPAEKGVLEHKGTINVLVAPPIDKPADSGMSNGRT